MPDCWPSRGPSGTLADRVSVVRLDRLRLGVVVLLCTLASGCFWSRNPQANCNEKAEYQSATEVPPIVIPKDLTAPPASGTFAVPPARQPVQQPTSASADAKADPRRVPGAACLDRPPDFFPKGEMPANK